MRYIFVGKYNNWNNNKYLSKIIFQEKIFWEKWNGNVSLKRERSVVKILIIKKIFFRYFLMDVGIYLL